MHTKNERVNTNICYVVLRIVSLVLLISCKDNLFNAKVIYFEAVKMGIVKYYTLATFLQKKFLVWKWEQI